MGRDRGIQYKPGSFYRSDDRSGFTRRAEQTEKEWTELIVGKDLWEARQPQDFVRGVADDQTVPDARPAPPPTFAGPFSIQLSREALIGQSIIHLDNLIDLSRLDPVGVMTDQGGYFFSFIEALLPDQSAVLIGRALTYYASAGNLLTDFLVPQAVAPAASMAFAKITNSGYTVLIAGGC